MIRATRLVSVSRYNRNFFSSKGFLGEASGSVSVAKMNGPDVVVRCAWDCACA